jgi:nucleoside-diphosphate-sugar epimerase
MSKGTILITGATGFVGSAILIEALKSGYSAHIVVRSESKLETLKSAPDLAALDKASECKYFVVPDLTIPGCLNEAAVGADFIIHAATPMPFQAVAPEKQYDELIAPVKRCTIAALEAARESGTVRRVVCVSSAAAFATTELLGPTWVPSEDLFLSEESLNEYFEPPFLDMFTAYAAMKTAGVRSAIEWMGAAEGLAFDLVNLAPVYICGRNPLAKTTAELSNGSNGMFLRSVATGAAPPLAGGSKDGPRPFGLSFGVALSDVVAAHLAALDQDLVKTPESGPNKGVETFTIGVNFAWNDINGLVEKMWPEAVSSGLLPNQGNFLAKPKVFIDSKKFEKVFGMKLKELDKMLPELIPQYLELQEKEKV